MQITIISKQVMTDVWKAIIAYTDHDRAVTSLAERCEAELQVMISQYKEMGYSEHEARVAATDEVSGMFKIETVTLLEEVTLD